MKNGNNWLSHNHEFKKDILDFNLKHGYNNFDTVDLALDYGVLKCKWWGNGAMVKGVVKTNNGKWDVVWN